MTTSFERYTNFFERAFGNPPYDYQRRLVEDDASYSLVNVPTGAGKTNAILGMWLWNRLTGSRQVGRRLVYCLPMRSLVEQTRRVAEQAVERLDLKDRFSVHTLMGGDVDLSWDVSPERECILIGTQDMLVSRALNRGYAMSRFRWPLHFGLLNNDVLWVYDEIQLMAAGLGTTTQLAAFRDDYGTFGPHDSIWMSATLDPAWLETIDFTPTARSLPILTLGKVDLETETLARRLNAVKRLAPAPHECRTPSGLAAFAIEAHRPGTQTLVVVNRVERAKETYTALAKAAAAIEDEGARPRLLLVHSRFRPHERKLWASDLEAEIADGGPGRIVVATQVVEAGLDISSRLLVTDAAPYASLVQRFGRCNRKGEIGEALVYWVDRPVVTKDEKLASKGELDEKERERIAAPYVWRDVEAAMRIIEALSSASPADLPAHSDSYEPEHVIRRKDMLDLFDTTPDLSGFDVDVSRFVRGGEDKDVSVAWRSLDEMPPREIPQLRPDEICSVPLWEMKGFLAAKSRIGGGQRAAFWWDALEGKWRLVRSGDLRPGLTIVIDSREGGYDTALGWSPTTAAPVAQLSAEGALPESYRDDPLSVRDYVQTLAAHSREARDEARRLLDALDDLGLKSVAEDLLDATHRHDHGKAHPVFQRTLHKGLVGLDGQLLAKSTSRYRHERSHFRHELASALALLQSGASALAVYLAACHHGKVRLSIRSLPGEESPGDGLKFARGIYDGDELPAVSLDDLDLEALRLDLEPMLLGSSSDGSPSWLDRMLALRDRQGIFRLAFLECLIRAADVQASRAPKEVLS